MWIHRPSGAMHVVVRRALTAESRNAGEQYERGRAEIDPVHGRVFIGSSDRGLYALRSDDGSTIWRFETMGVVQCEPLYDAGRDTVYFGSHDGALYAVRASDGQLLFRFATGAEVTRKPVLVDGTLFVANGNDTLFALDAANGKTKWQAHRSPALGMEVAGYAGPAFDRGKIYMAFSDGNVTAYDAKDGAERWTPVDLGADAERVAGETPKYLDVDTTPVFDDMKPGVRAVFVASYVGGVSALDSETGSRLWSNDQASGVTDLLLWTEPAHTPNADGPYAGGPAVPERHVLVASSATTGVWGMDPLTGRMLWKNKVPDGGVTAPVPVAGALVVGTTRYGLFLMSPREGLVIDGFDVGTGFAVTPAAFGHRAFAMSNTGIFVGVDVNPPIALGHRGHAWPAP